MRLSDRLGPGEDSDALARCVLDVTLAGLRSSPPSAFTSSMNVNGFCAVDDPDRVSRDANVS
jgi:hypothetical protein